MINNRQGGRRRGRGGQRGPNPGGQPGGNRQDNRQRGNAAQLLEKYKNMARDAQLAGDRVQAEYYLQFADHYFRVLNENRARFEDQRRQRGEEFDDGEDDEEELIEAEDGQEAPEERPEEERAPRRDNRRERGRRFNRDGRDSRDEGEPGAQPGNGYERAAEERIAADVLPPAIGADSLPPSIGGEGPAEVVEVTPRRRARRPRPPADDGEIAPAA